MSTPAGGLVVRTITVSEVMDDEGDMWITVDTTGEPMIWHQLGLLEAAAESVRIAVRTMWSEDD